MILQKWRSFDRNDAFKAEARESWSAKDSGISINQSLRSGVDNNSNCERCHGQTPRTGKSTAHASPTVGKRRLTLGTRIRQLRHENVTDDRPGNARRRDV